MIMCDGYDVIATSIDCKTKTRYEIRKVADLHAILAKVGMLDYIIQYCGGYDVAEDGNNCLCCVKRESVAMVIGLLVAHHVRRWDDVEVHPL